jgi:RNA polymerase sigma-70 factor (ECF subfamily)
MRSRRAKPDRPERGRGKRTEALRRLFAAYYPGIKRYFADHVGSIDDAEDLAEEVFLRFCERTDLPDDPEAYAHTIARNLLSKYHKNRAKRAQAALLQVIERLPNARTTGPRPPRLPIDLVDELKAIIKSEQIQLPPRTLDAIRLIYVEQLPAREVAGRLGCSTEALYKRLQRARKLLRDTLRRRQRQS